MQIFQVAILVAVLDFRMVEGGGGGVVGLVASIKLSLQCTLFPLDEGPSTPKSGSLGLVADVSATGLGFFFSVKSC